MNKIDQILGESMISYSTNRPLILPVQSISLIDHTVLSVNSSNDSHHNTIMNVATSVQSVFDNMIDQRNYTMMSDSLGLSITKS